jgi:hypothetical protein
MRRSRLTGKTLGGLENRVVKDEGIHPVGSAPDNILGDVHLR